MKLLRACALAAVVAVLGGVAYFAEEQKSAGAQMADAAAKFLATLTPEQRAKARFAFDDKERTNWIFVPMQDAQKRPTRKGLRLEEMTQEQKNAVLELLRSGTSPRGFEQAVAIMSLETILHDLEKNGAMVRNPGWYFVSIFGTPARTGSWGWRVEGHHLSLNFTVKDGEVASATPAFFGANPAVSTTPDGARKPVLSDVEEVAQALIQSLDADQKKAARQPKHFGEPTDKSVAEKVGDPVGVPGAKLTPVQRDLLAKLLKAYTARMPATVAAAQWKQVADAGLEKAWFAYSGDPSPGKGYTYRVQGPTYIVQFLNVQADSAKNPANHIHSAWRELPSDFALTAK